MKSSLKASQDQATRPDTLRRLGFVEVKRNGGENYSYRHDPRVIRRIDIKGNEISGHRFTGLLNYGERITEATVPGTV